MSQFTPLEFTIENLIEKGYQSISFRLTNTKDDTTPSTIRITTKNPLCRRLIDIFKTEGVLEFFLKQKDDSFFLKANKPNNINDSFFSAGYFVISKKL